MTRTQRTFRDHRSQVIPAAAVACALAMASAPAAALHSGEAPEGFLGPAVLRLDPAAHAAAEGPAMNGRMRLAPHLDSSELLRAGGRASPCSELSLAAFSQEQPPPFGASGSRRWNLIGGLGVDVKDSRSRMALAGFGVSFFVVKNLSLDLGFNAMYFDQEGPSAWGGNFHMLFRWHFLAQENWSVYFDGGAGVLGTSRRVPQDGTHFNFTPQAGFGASFDIGGDLRLLTGVRWHHISNANTARNNPGRDSIMGYAGISVPF